VATSFLHRAKETPQKANKIIAKKPKSSDFGFFFLLFFEINIVPKDT